MPEAALSEIYNYLPIDEKLATAGQPSVAELGAVARAGFEVVINLALHDDPRYSLPDEAGTVTGLGMTYVHLPVQFGAPNEDDLNAFFAAMERHRGRKVFLHCAANKRVTAFLGLYRRFKEGHTVETAFAPMREIWEPNEVWSAFIAARLASLMGK